MQILPRDYLISERNLAFAVVDRGIEENRVACQLRYQRSNPNDWKKLESDEASALLKQQFPHYLFHSKRRDAVIHGVPMQRIESHRPARAAFDRMHQIFSSSSLGATAIAAVNYLASCNINRRHLGLSGSLLLDAATDGSDIDLVAYHRDTFESIRKCFSLAAGPFAPLSSNDWKRAYKRRGAAMPFDVFLWHEQRKNNKSMFGSTKIDISLVSSEFRPDQCIWQKRGPVRCTARVIDDRDAFNTPARWKLDHPKITEVVSFTATFTGQARAGEQVEIVGLLEENQKGIQRVILGQSREANDAAMRVSSATFPPGIS